MAIVLADRRDIQTRQLHRRIANRFQTGGSFGSVQHRVTEPREPGPYRVVALTEPRVFLDDAASPVTTARIEVGFELRDEADHSWFNWTEPEREFLLGWHHDGDHPDLGPVHVQVNHAGRPVVHVPATFIDTHPMAVPEARLDQVKETLARVRWQDGVVTGIERGLMGCSTGTGERRGLASGRPPPQLGGACRCGSRGRLGSIRTAMDSGHSFSSPS